MNTKIRKKITNLICQVTIIVCLVGVIYIEFGEKALVFSFSGEMNQSHLKISNMFNDLNREIGYFYENNGRYPENLCDLTNSVPANYRIIEILRSYDNTPKYVCAQDGNDYLLSKDIWWESCYWVNRRTRHQMLFSLIAMVLLLSAVNLKLITLVKNNLEDSETLLKNYTLVILRILCTIYMVLFLFKCLIVLSGVST